MRKHFIRVYKVVSMSDYEINASNTVKAKKEAMHLFKELHLHPVRLGQQYIAVVINEEDVNEQRRLSEYYNYELRHISN